MRIFTTTLICILLFAILLFSLIKRQDSLILNVRLDKITTAIIFLWKLNFIDPTFVFLNYIKFTRFHAI